MNNQPATQPAPRRTLTWRRRGLFVLIAFVLAMVLIEGLCSWGVFLGRALTQPITPVAERQHTQYDADLGWVNKPDVHVKHLYGRNKSVTINGQQFRATQTYETNPPAGKVRVICNGDSFTFGHGVDDSETWPAMLERINPRVQAINMGQGGYGLDQMYLWYERDGRRLEHQVHIVAVIGHDIHRMRIKNFLGYDKPTLTMHDGRVTAANTPVPKRSFHAPWLTQNIPLLQELRFVSLTSKLIGHTPASGEQAAIMTLEQASEMGVHAMLQMSDRDTAHGSRLVFVWLPTQDDTTPQPADNWRTLILAALQQRGVIVYDLVQPMRNLPAETVKSMFIQPGDSSHPTAAGHYTPKGNYYIAQLIDIALRDTPQLRGIWPTSDTKDTTASQ